MKEETVNKVCAFWEMIYDDDISIERLLEMCRGEFNFRDVSDVISALVKGGILKEDSEE